MEEEERKVLYMGLKKTCNRRLGNFGLSIIAKHCDNKVILRISAFSTVSSTTNKCLNEFFLSVPTFCQ